MTTLNISLVVATKDRPRELKNMLRSLQDQSVRPDEIIIVDGGDKQIEYVLKEFPDLDFIYMQLRPPSGTKQRNLGIKAAGSADLIGIMDDDIVLEKHALKNMLLFWKHHQKELGGAAFNLVNHPELFAESVKAHPLLARLGIYSKQRGKVLPSGFQTLIGEMDKTGYFDWLPSTAVVYRQDIFKDFLFDEWFKGYSYLEDLDFSYAVGKKYKLAVVHDAEYRHFPGPGGRGNGFEFGVREVLNRIHFVKKHKELSLVKCLLTLRLRQLISLWIFFRGRNTYFLYRAAGNSFGFLRALKTIIS